MKRFLKKKKSIPIAKTHHRHINFFKAIPNLIFLFIKKIHTFLRLLFIAIIASIVAFFIIMNNIDPNEYKGDVQDALNRIIKREVKIEGDLKWHLFSFEPGIKLQKISIKNTPWAKTEHIVTADNIIIMLSFKDLLSRKISLDTLLIETPKIFLEVSTKGAKNWLIDDEGTNKKSPNFIPIKEFQTMIATEEEKFRDKIKLPKFEIAIKNIKIENAFISYYNRQTNVQENIELDKLWLHSDSYSSPILLDINAKYKGGKYNAQFKTTSFFDLLNKVPNTPVIGILNLNGIHVDLRVRIPDISRLNYATVNMNFDAPQLQKSLANFVKLPNMMDMNGRVDLIITPTFISVKKIGIIYDSLELTGDAEISLNKKPSIRAEINIPYLDIPNIFFPLWEGEYFKRVKNNISKPKRIGPGIENPMAFRNIPLPISELDLLNIILKLNIGRLKAMPEMPIDNINVGVNLNNGNAVIAPFSFDYMGGNVSLDIVANNSNNTFNGEVMITGGGVSIGKIIDSTGYKKIFEGGSTNMDIALKGHGPNLAEFMKNLNGYLKLYTTNNLIGYRVENVFLATDLVSSILKFIGDDIIGTLTLQDKKPEKSDIQCIVANLNIQDGKTISNRGIALQTKVANIIVDGMADLGQEDLDVSIITVVKEGFKISASLAEMIKIKGAMAAPEIIISKDGVINNMAKTAFATALVGTLTGGITLITAGLGLVTKSWINNIREDNNPCLTAFESRGGKDNNAKQQEDYQILFKENISNTVEEQKQKLDKIANDAINKSKQIEKKKIK